MKRAFAAAIAAGQIAGCAAVASAQWWANEGGSTSTTVCDRDRTLRPLEYSARDTYTLRFVGRTLSGSPTVTVTCMSCTQSDASPSSIVYGTPSVSGADVTFTLAPDTGCGTSGCRAGNWYLVTVQATAGDNLPVAKVCLPVVNEQLVVQ